MPIANTINNTQQIIYSPCTGVMGFIDFTDYINRVWSDSRYFGYNELFDTTRAAWTEFDFGFLLDLAKQTAKLSTIEPNSKLVWLVLEGKQQELSDFYKAAKSMLNSPSRSLQAFCSKDEALTWLAL